MTKEAKGLPFEEGRENYRQLLPPLEAKGLDALRDLAATWERIAESNSDYRYNEALRFCAKGLHAALAAQGGRSSRDAGQAMSLQLGGGGSELGASVNHEGDDASIVQRQFNGYAAQEIVKEHSVSDITPSRLQEKMNMQQQA